MVKGLAALVSTLRHVNSSAADGSVYGAFNLVTDTHLCCRVAVTLTLFQQNRLFYRRTGALWTDLYHTPPERLKLVNYRPDLDASALSWAARCCCSRLTPLPRAAQRLRCVIAEHAEAVAAKIERERAEAAQEMMEKVKFRQRRRLHMQRRMRDNREYAYKPRPKAAAAVRKVDGHAVKDHYFYRRTGFMWSDYAQTPDERLHLVVRPMIVRGDQRASEVIRRKRAEEAVVSEIVDKVRADAREETRAAFQLRCEENRALAEPIRAVTAEGAYLQHRKAKRMSASASSLPRREQLDSIHGDTRAYSVDSRAARASRIEELAKPIKRSVDARKVSATSDYAGLLAADSVVMHRVIKQLGPDAARPAPKQASTSLSRRRLEESVSEAALVSTLPDTRRTPRSRSGSTDRNGARSSGRHPTVREDAAGVRATQQKAPSGKGRPASAPQIRADERPAQKEMPQHSSRGTRSAAAPRSSEARQAPQKGQADVSPDTAGLVRQVESFERRLVEKELPKRGPAMFPHAAVLAERERILGHRDA